MKKKYCWFLAIVTVVCGLNFSWSQTNVAPYLNATGNQIYCPGTSIKIVTNMTIIDPDDTGIDAIYIQISSGYDASHDSLTLTGNHPNVSSGWNSTTGILTLTGVSGQPTYAELIAAINDIEYSSNASNPTGTRNFSITVGQANYLPSNGHYYLYIPNTGITWTAAKIAAENSSYYGLQGYLATITSAEEAQISGEQTTGAGWIGGSDEETEGVWKWMTGPEVGTVFWNGNFNGSSPNFAFWNNGEPNNLNNEDYAHVTAPGVGITGSWNDLSNTGDPSGDYQPKGYIVEYGGMPGDPILHIATSTTITITSLTSNTPATRCGTGSVTLQAVSNSGIVNWYSAATGGLPIATGNSFTTPSISSTTVFYAAASYNGCPDVVRVPVTASVIPTPVLTVNSPYTMCEDSSFAIDLVTSIGTIYWYDSLSSVNPIFTGTHFVVPNIHQNTTYYAEANNNGCLSGRVAIDINVFPSPTATDEVYDLCENQIITLNAGNPGMVYLWSTGETTQSISSTGLTNYSVEITTPAPGNCSKTKNFNITYHLQPVILNVNVTDLEVTIITTQQGDFEYSLDGIFYQPSNIFTVPEGGMYTAYVRERNFCGSDNQNFIVISIPDFFTPNGDNVNDFWYIKGIAFFPDAQVKIFDRFGKLVAVLNRSNPFWDGTYNGHLLPSTDYWFVAKMNSNTPEVRGHFAMLR